MPTSTPSWTTADKKIHTDYVKSLKHELFLWLSKVGDNEVGARKICEALDKDTIGPFIDTLEILEDELIDPKQFEVVEVVGAFVPPKFLSEIILESE